MRRDELQILTPKILYAFMQCVLIMSPDMLQVTLGPSMVQCVFYTAVICGFGIFGIMSQDLEDDASGTVLLIEVV